MLSEAKHLSPAEILRFAQDDLSRGIGDIEIDALQERG
jgi:hypothetical protein